jgi:hypothetical protein
MARFYVAGPLTGLAPGEQLRNVQRAMEVGRALMEKGHSPFVPHLSHWWDEHCTNAGSPVTYEEWMAYDNEWLRQCECFFHIASSPGADRELQWARDRGMTVYTRLEDVPEEVS